MMRLVIDGNALAHAAFHSMPELTAGELQTAVIFNMLVRVLSLAEHHRTNSVAWCFDGSGSHRRALFPDYKKARREITRTAEEEARYRQLFNQIDEMRHGMLQSLGFNNVFCEEGYEADDLIADLVRPKHNIHQWTIVSGDHDLFQLLRPKVSMLVPGSGKLYTSEWFEKEYGLAPIHWAVVKAIAGCNTDGVPGVQGVGEKTAVKYLLGKVKPDSVAGRRIEKWEDGGGFRRNIKLVRLPFASLRLHLVKDNFIEERMRNVFSAYKMKSQLADKQWQRWQGFINNQWTYADMQWAHRSERLPNGKQVKQGFGV